MKIVHEREKCIGCGTCAAVCSKHWEMSKDGKSHLIDSSKDSSGNEVKEIEKIECNQEAADSCPVQCIHVQK